LFAIGSPSNFDVTSQLLIGHYPAANWDAHPSSFLVSNGTWFRNQLSKKNNIRQIERNSNCFFCFLLPQYLCLYLYLYILYIYIYIHLIYIYISIFISIYLFCCVPTHYADVLTCLSLSVHFLPESATTCSSFLLAHVLSLSGTMSRTVFRRVYIYIWLYVYYIMFNICFNVQRPIDSSLQFWGQTPSLLVNLGHHLAILAMAMAVAGQILHWPVSCPLVNIQKTTEHHHF